MLDKEQAPTETVEKTNFQKQREAVNSIIKVHKERSEVDGEIKAWCDLLKVAANLFLAGEEDKAVYLRDLADAKLVEVEKRQQETRLRTSDEWMAAADVFEL